jgi:uncharacterized membrane protein YqjE
MTGLLGFIRRIGDAMVTGAQGPLDLWADELHAEKLRLIRLVIWAGAAVSIAREGLTIGGWVAMWLPGLRFHDRRGRMPRG